MGRKFARRKAELPDWVKRGHDRWIAPGARRAATAALAIRFTLLMTLMEDADYAEVLETLLGGLLLVP